MKNIYLTRHGSTVWNLEKRLQGSNDSELTEDGLRQAEDLGKKIEEIGITKIYTSPIKRAYRTANIIRGNKNIDIVVDEGFKEISFGEYEGSIESELLEEGRGHEISKIFNGEIDIKAPGGESLRELYDRVSVSLDKIIKECEDENILIVTHGTTLKAIICYFTGKLEFPNFIMGQATLSKIVIDEDKFMVEYINDDSHLVKINNKTGW